MPAAILSWSISPHWPFDVTFKVDGEKYIDWPNNTSMNIKY